MRKLLRDLNRLFDFVIGTGAYLAAALIIFVTLSTTVAVLTRYLFNEPLIWAVELSGYSLVFVTFLGTAWVLKREQHVKLDLVLNALKPNNRAWLNIVTSSLGCLVCLIVCVFSIIATASYYQLHYTTPTLLKVPQWIILIAIPAGTLLLTLQFARRTYGYWKGLKPQAS